MLKDPRDYVYREDVVPHDRHVRGARLVAFWLSGRIVQQYCGNDVIGHESYRSDIARAYAVAADVSSGPEDIECFLNEVERHTREAVELYWEAVQAVAERLLTRGMLSDSEVNQIIHDIYGPFEEIMQRIRAS